MEKRYCFKILIFVFFAIFLAGCNDNSLKDKRAKLATKAQGDIQIGFVWSEKKGLWSGVEKGVEFAAEQINAAGGINGRKLKIIKKYDHHSVNEGIKIAHEFANNLKINLVIGPFYSYIAIPSSSVYEFAGVLMLTPGSTTSRLTHQGFSHIFRMVPNNTQMGQVLARYAKKRGYKKVMILYTREEYGGDLANAFEKEAQAQGIQVENRISYLDEGKTVYNILQNWHQFYKFDAIFLAGFLPQTAHIIKYARSIGIKQPIFGADDMTGKELIDIAGKSAEGAVGVLFFKLDAKRPIVKKFIQAYKKKYGVLPNEMDALGYDAVLLLSDAIAKTGTDNAEQVAKYLRSLKNWQGVTGKLSFDKKGDMVNTDNLVLEAVHNGRFNAIT
jgi:branched-chain amino acid transport system substrate-binding protein